MKTIGESMRDLAVHSVSATRDYPGIGAGMVSYAPDCAQERAVALYELLDALDASARDGEVRLEGSYIRWTHTPEEGEAYEVSVYFR